MFKLIIAISVLMVTAHAGQNMPENTFSKNYADIFDEPVCAPIFNIFINTVHAAPSDTGGFVPTEARDVKCSLNGPTPTCTIKSREYPGYGRKSEPFPLSQQDSKKLYNAFTSGILASYKKSDGSFDFPYITCSKSTSRKEPKINGKPNYVHDCEIWFEKPNFLM